MNNIYPDRLVQARALRKVKAIDLASALHWTPVRLSRTETSPRADISDAELDIIVDTLNFPRAFFMRPPAPELMYGGILHRRTKRTNKTELTYWDELARHVADFALDLHSLRSLPPVMLPTVDHREPVQASAAEVRKRLGLAPAEPIDNLILEVRASWCGGGAPPAGLFQRFPERWAILRLLRMVTRPRQTGTSPSDFTEFD